MEKRGLNLIKYFSLADLDTHKIEINEELNKAGSNNFEDMDFKKELTYDEIVDILDIKHLDGSTIGYTLLVGIYEISDLNSMLHLMI